MVKVAVSEEAGQVLTMLTLRGSEGDQGGGAGRAGMEVEN